jgi:hypothetical protein
VADARQGAIGSGGSSDARAWGVAEVRDTGARSGRSTDRWLVIAALVLLIAGGLAAIAALVTTPSRAIEACNEAVSCDGPDVVVGRTSAGELAVFQTECGPQVNAILVVREHPYLAWKTDRIAKADGNRAPFVFGEVRSGWVGPFFDADPRTIDGPLQGIANFDGIERAQAIAATTASLQPGTVQRADGVVPLEQWSAGSHGCTAARNRRILVTAWVVLWMVAAVVGIVVVRRRRARRRAAYAASHPVWDRQTGGWIHPG